MKNKLFTLFVLSLFTFHFSPLMASDWVLNESKYNATDKTDHIKLEVFLCDLDGKNTYCDGGTVIATNDRESYDLLTLKYHDEADDAAANENITAKLVMHNSKAWVTNATYGSKELNSSEQTFQVNKWANDHHYMTAEIDFYYPAELAGHSWKIYFHFKHSNGDWYDMVLQKSIYINNHLGLSEYNVAGYQVERSGIDKMAFTMPKLPDDIPSKVSSIRSRKATYDVRYTFHKQDGSTEVVEKTYEPSTTQEKKEEVTFPDGVGNPRSIDCRVYAEHGIKDPDNWFNHKVRTDDKIDAFKVVPDPDAITTEYRQFDKKAVLTWTTPSSDRYMAVTPYIYRIETDENGTPKSGKSWSKRGNLNSTQGGALSFTDDDVAIGTYFRYMVVNVPTDFINHGINESSLNSLSDDLLAKLGSNTSTVMNTAPQVSIYDLQQDTSVTDKVRLTWRYTRVPTSDATVNFKVLRKTSINGEWTEYATISGDAKPAAGGNLSFEDSDLPNSIVRYQYKVRLEMGTYRFESEVVAAGLLAGTSLKEFTATKGTHDGSVTLAWKAKQIGTDNSNYIISRRYVNSTGEFMQIHSTNGADENYTFDDNTVKPGYYYEYKIEVYDGGLLQNTLYTVGFCQSRGTVSGRVQFGTGTAVPNVRLWLRPADIGEENTVRGASQYVYDASEGIAWGADATELGKVFGADKDFTVQFFVRPDEGLSEDAILSDIPGIGQLTIGDIALPFGKYSLLTLIKTGNQLSIQVDSSEVTTISVEPQDITAPFSLGGAVGITSAQAFKGNFAEVRVWDHALSESEKKQYYDRMLNGRESGLALYWPLEEGLARYAFDASYANDLPNGRHATIGANITPSTIVPAEAQLARYGMTNDQGEYIIRGIPFKGSGSSYSLVPEKGVHEFNPHNRSLFISPTSLTANNIDFEDVSSFPMTGHIYYAGTNIPVEGMMFYVDGELQSSEGSFVTTDANGYYSLSVPIGEHYVEAKLSGHTMVAGGRYPTVGKFNFTDRVQHDFLDSTFVNFIGRVAGGTANDTLPVGFRASKNNIGTATITLRLNSEAFSFNVQDKDHITPAATDRSFESDTVSINSHTWTGSTEAANTKYIYIHTDSATGEFSAKLPPLKYVVKSIVIGSNEHIEFNSLPEIDLTSVQKVMKDSMKVVTLQGDSAWTYFSYHTKMVQTYFAEPQVSLWQVNGDGGFGEKELKDYPISSTDTVDIADIWTKDEQGKLHYTYGFPVFGRQRNYKFGVFGYEAYTNYDSGKAMTDTIPMNGQVLTVANEMSDEQDVVARVIDPSQTDLKQGDIYNLKSNQVCLDEEGKNEITFTTGAPNVTAPYTRQFSIAFERNKRTYSGTQLNGVVLGELTNGNNFVTQGPDHVDMVLRDPPGAKGKTTWKTGTSWTTIDYSTKGTYWDETGTFDLIWGANLKTVVGTGVAIVSGSQATTTSVVGESGTFSWLKQDDKTYVYTSAENISTSTGSKYVGADGDIFIGKSHNFIIGTCRRLGFHQEGDSIVLGLKEAVSINDSIATNFMFTTREIKETMIPKTIETRNALLEYMNEAAAKAFTNTTDKDIYLTWLTPDDPNYGANDTYVWKQGTKGRSQDLVLHYNESVRLWKETLAENEQDKIEAFHGTQYFKANRSFDGGTAYTYSERRDTTKSSSEITNKKVGVVYEVKTRCAINTAQTFGSNVNFKTALGHIVKTVEGDSLDNTKSYIEFDYELNDGNPGTDFTVDIYRSPRGWSDIFLLRGGQSYNPYEGLEYAQYYEPESQHVISYGTQQMEQPILQISTDGNVGAKTAMLTDVPAGQTGQFTLHATNGSTTNQSIPFGYDLKILERTNTKGLEILMDGTPINDRTLWIPKGETVKKIITVRQTDQSVLDYDSVELYLYSMYQPAKINDHVTIGVHFMPSSSPVVLTAENPVINTDPTTGKGKLNLKLSGFNRQFKNLKNIGIQYRFAGNTQWTTLHTWVTDIADSTSESFSPLPATGDIRWTEDMSDNISYPEGEYEFRAFTTTPYGNDPVQVFSETTKVIKDMTLPRPLFTPAPANGILGIGEQLAVEFNEDIVPGYVGDKNIIITAKLNGRPVDHEVSYHLYPYGRDVQTVNPVFLNGNFSLEFWINLHDNGTILHQGAGSGNFALNTDSEGHMYVSVLSKTFPSTATLPKDKWIFIAMNYKAETMTFNMLAQYDETTVYLFSDETVPMESVEGVDYTEDNYLYLGPINANIHHLALYNIYRDVLVAGSEKNKEKDAYTYGLSNYWPMTEGHGKIAADTRRTHDFKVNNSWTIANTSYALAMGNIVGAQADISLINTGMNDSYAIEFWYRPSFLVQDTIFETENMCLHYDAQQNLVLDYGTKSKVVAAHADFPDGTTGWHHMALNVVRGQAASFYFDGKRTAVIAEADVPVLKGASLALAKNAALANIDELRIWKATISEERLLSNMYNTIDTSDVYARGLIAYYPFEKDSIINGVNTKGETMQNMAPKSYTGTAGDIIALSSMVLEDTPPVKNAPSETRITAVPVASERKVVINLSQAEVSARDIEGTTLNITLAEVHDLHGNTSNPIKWTAYVQQNTLKWRKDSVNIHKKYGEEYTFDVDIENLSGQIEYYTVANMPSWLSLVDGNGQMVNDQMVSGFEVSPLKTQTLRFAVNPLVLVGNYDVTIGLQGNNEILEPLRIVMKVRGETPDWSVDPTLYEHQMSIVGQIYLGGILMENPESLVAAFIGSECRGVAAPKQERGAAFVSLNIYGHDTSKKDAGKPVTFRIWDATKGIAYTDANIAIEGKDTMLVFHDGELIGSFDYPAIWTKSDKVEQLIPVHENWNWIAFGVEPNTQYCNILFADYNGWGILLKDTASYIQSNGAQWKGGDYPLVPMVNKMYKMKITRTPATETAVLQPQLSISGKRLPADSMRVQIEKNWNWMPYTPLTTMTVDEALAGANPRKGDIIKSQKAFAIYGNGNWEGELTALEPGNGYLYFSNDPTKKSFTYPQESYKSNAPGYLGAPLKAFSYQHSDLRYFHPVDKHNYPSNMTMTIRLLDGDAVVDTCEIGAFVSDECRGAIRADAEGLYYLVIAGEGAGQAMEIKTVLNGEIVTIDNSLTFTSDDHIGTPWEPYVIQLQPTQGIEQAPITNDQSPVTNKVIRDNRLLILKGDKTYNVLGQPED